MNFIKAKGLPIREAFGGESFVQNLLAEDPSLLGLGDLYLRGKERVQASSGRLDLLFESSDGRCWYEVEVQLGATNETHIIRTIEYWDNERRHYPDKEHVAVIVAEHINGRFFNVIGLFNRHIPILAIQMNALEVEGKHTITFTKILDHSVSTSSSTEEEDFEAADRAYWVKRTSEKTMKIVDDIAEIAQKEDPSSLLKYNAGYIAIKRLDDGLHSRNFIHVRPRKKEIMVSVFSLRVALLEETFSKSNLRFEYEEIRAKYLLFFSEGEYGQVREALVGAIRSSYKQLREIPIESSPETEV